MSLTDEPLDSPTSWVANQTRRYVETDGAEAGTLRGSPCLVLTTMGRRSGSPRRTTLIYGRDGDAVILVASMGGVPKNPLWYLNLVADPEVLVQIGADVFTGRAETVPSQEKARLWPVMCAVYAPYDDYQRRTSRDIPVIRVRRTV